MLSDYLFYKALFPASGEGGGSSGGATRIFLHNVGDWYETLPMFGDDLYRVSANTPTKSQLSGLVIISAPNVGENSTTIVDSNVLLISDDEILEEEGVTVIFKNETMLVAVIPEDIGNAFGTPPGLYMSGTALANKSVNSFDSINSIILVYGG